MELPEPFELQFEKQIKEFEEAGKMTYITTIERRAIEQGIEQGRLQTARDIVLEVLALRFPTALQELSGQINQLTEIDWLKTLLRQAVVAGTLEEFEHFMETARR
jgi:hypothetical protein